MMLPTAVFIAFMASSITVWLAFRRFKRESTWTKKFEAYSKILDGLHVCRLRAERLHHESEFDWKITDEQREELGRRYSDASADLLKIVDTGRLVLPIVALEPLEKAMNLDARRIMWEEVPSFEFWDNEEAIYRSALDMLVEVAKRDLKTAKR